MTPRDVARLEYWRANYAPDFWHPANPAVLLDLLGEVNDALFIRNDAADSLVDIHKVLVIPARNGWPAAIEMDLSAIFCVRLDLKRGIEIPMQPPFPEVSPEQVTCISWRYRDPDTSPAN